jgi:hypothetical protein
MTSPQPDQTAAHSPIRDRAQTIAIKIESGYAFEHPFDDRHFVPRPIELRRKRTHAVDPTDHIQRFIYFSEKTSSRGSRKS